MAAAKKRGGKKRAGKKKAGKKRTGKKRTGMSPAARKKVIAQRIMLHVHASELPDFKGGRSPVRSGCGRPRTKKR